MRVYIGFDDTDTRESAVGTGKLAQCFEAEMPGDGHLWGVVRQQLLVHDDIPYTSHRECQVPGANVVPVPKRSL